MSVSKNRYWMFEYYDRTNEDLIFQKLESTHVKITLSPWHDKDVNHDGTVKAGHRHVMACFDGPTTYRHAQEVFADIAANGYVEAVNSARGMYRYFCHLDNAEKYQYPEEERKHFNGFNPVDLMSETDKNLLIFEVDKLISERKIKEYDDLIETLINEGMMMHYHVAHHNTIHFSARLNSRRNKAKQLEHIEEYYQAKIKKMESKRDSM